MRRNLSRNREGGRFGYTSTNRRDQQSMSRPGWGGRSSQLRSGGGDWENGPQSLYEESDYYRRSYGPGISQGQSHYGLAGREHEQEQEPERYDYYRLGNHDSEINDDYEIYDEESGRGFRPGRSSSSFRSQGSRDFDEYGYENTTRNMEGDRGHGLNYGSSYGGSYEPSGRNYGSGGWDSPSYSQNRRGFGGMYEGQTRRSSSRGGHASRTGTRGVRSGRGSHSSSRY